MCEIAGAVSASPAVTLSTHQIWPSASTGSHFCQFLLPARTLGCQLWTLGRTGQDPGGPGSGLPSSGPACPPSNERCVGGTRPSFYRGLGKDDEMPKETWKVGLRRPRPLRPPSHQLPEWPVPSVPTLPSPAWSSLPLRDPVWPSLGPRGEAEASERTELRADPLALAPSRASPT